MIRYGIISTASIVSRFVAGINESKNGKVQAIASRSLEKAREAAAKMDIKNYYGSYEELYQDADIDVVYIPTVNGLHYRDCKAALQHHKNVIVEKPFVMTEAQARELFDLALENRCFLMEAQKAVHLPVTKKIKELLGANVIGPVKYAEFKAGFPGRFTYDHWMYDLAMGGGALYGSATYTIEYLQYLLDEPNFEIDGTCIKCPTGADEICNFQLTIDNNILVSSTIAMNVPLVNEAVFYGDKGYLTVPNYWKSDRLTVTLYEGTSETYEFPFESEFVYEVDHINECIEAGLLESTVMTSAKTIEAVKLVESLYRKWTK